MTKWLLPIPALMLASSTALAGPFVVRTSRPTYADTAVARPVTIAKEWAEFSLEYDFRDVTKGTDTSGKTYTLDYKYQYSWLTFRTRYGFTRNLTLFLDMPYSVQSHRSGGNDGSNSVTDSGLGDARFGMIWQFYAHEAGDNLTSLALQWDTKQPTGNESPGSIGDRHLLLGTGTTNTGLTVIGKQRVGPVAFTGDVGYIHKFSAVTQWTRDLDAPAGLNARFKPGNELDAGLHALVQPVRLAAVDLGADYVNRGNAEIGHTANGINPAADLQTVPGSSFQALNAAAKVIVDYDVNWDFALGVVQPVMSKNSGYFFPMEDLSQSYGTTFSGQVIFRW